MSARPTLLTTLFNEEMARFAGGARYNGYWREFKYDLITLAEERGKQAGKTEREIFGNAKSTAARMKLLDDDRREYENRTKISLEDYGIDAAPAGEAFGEGVGYGVAKRIPFTADAPLEQPVALIVEKRTVAPQLAERLRSRGIQVFTTSGAAKNAHIEAVQRWRAAGVPVLLMSDEDAGGWTSLKSLEKAGGRWVRLEDLERVTGVRAGAGQITEDTSFTRQPGADFPPEVVERLRRYGKRGGIASGLGRVEMEGSRTAFGGYDGYAKAIADTIRETVGEVDYTRAVEQRIATDPDFLFGALFRRLREAADVAVRKALHGRNIRAAAGSGLKDVLARARLRVPVPPKVQHAFDALILALDEWKP